MRQTQKFVGLSLLVALIAIIFADEGLAETRVARHGDAVIEYLTDGKGPAVLMIASLGRPATDFDALSATLVAAGYSTNRPQPRGISGSSGPMTGINLRDLAADAMATIPADSGPVIVIGHDFGQRVARMVAAQYPERVKCVVMFAAGGKVPPLPGASEALRAAFDTKLSPEKHMEAVRFAFFAPGNDPTVWRDGWHADVAEMQVAATAASKTTEWWGAGRAPIAVIQGLQDVVAVPENARDFKKQFGDRVSLTEINHAGHAMLPEQPKEVTTTVLGYLNQSCK